jgi:hypothetical protein
MHLAGGRENDIAYLVAALDPKKVASEKFDEFGSALDRVRNTLADDSLSDEDRDSVAVYRDQIQSVIRRLRIQKGWRVWAPAAPSWLAFLVAVAFTAGMANLSPKEWGVRALIGLLFFGFLLLLPISWLKHLERMNAFFDCEDDLHAVEAKFTQMCSAKVRVGPIATTERERGTESVERAMLESDAPRMPREGFTRPK